MSAARHPTSEDEPGALPNRLILLHTSDARGVVGIATGDRVVGEVLDSHGQHARSLLGTLERLMQRAEMAMDTVEGCVVTLGPGSFTGIRIGLATAQGLTAARGCSVWVCDSLRPEAAAALPVPPAATNHAVGDAPVAVVQDARRGEVYAALYDVRAPVPRELVAPFCDAPGAACDRLFAAAPASRMILLGTGASLVATVPGAAKRIELRERPTGLAVLAALHGLARAGDCRKREPHQLAPTYLRRSDAEIKREQGS